MTSDEIRSAYLSFFESKDHKIIPSSSLIPQGDPTLLLTSAGMVQFKPYFLGEAVPPNPRLTSCQKCFRTTDIESVGDSRHLTFFEMLGNFSIGDYFKPEAISWAWEFVTQRLQLPPERLWVTVYLDDDDAFHYWRQLNVPEDRILRFGEKDNFWGPAGDSGPCGPCSEIHYDFGEAYGCHRPTCGPGCDCGRFSEVWNLVFTQYDQDKTGRRTPLPKPNIDTGMGLERMAAVMQGKTSVYETDLFTPLLERISGLTSKRYGIDRDVDHAMRVVAEHSRGVTFLIADGVMPDNEGRGYVLRRLLRRTALFSRRLGTDKPILAEMARDVISQMRHVYPEVEQRRDFILQVIEMEEARFGETLNTGLELLDGIMETEATQVRNKIAGEDVFRLYDTYGFPVELTREIAAGHSLAVDLEGFEKAMEQQRQKARATHKFVTAGDTMALADKVAGQKETPFVGYAGLSHRTSIINLLVDSQSVDVVRQGQKASLILAETPFYGEMGGQVGDTGEILGPGGRFTVTNTLRVPPDIVVHQGKVVEGRLAVGNVVEAEVDRERRLDIARNHTATHLLQAALRQVLGKHIQQRGSLVTPDRLRFDFSHLAAMGKEEINEVQRLVNERVRQDLPVYDEVVPYKKAIEEGVIALFEEKYGDVVRVLRVGRPPVSAELCGGTHVMATGEIGFFYVVGETSVGAGLRRIEAVTGREAETLLSHRLATLDNIAQLLSALPDEVGAKVSGALEALEAERRRVQDLRMQLVEKSADSILARAEVINGIKVLVEKVAEPVPMPVLRSMGDKLRDKLGSGIIVLATVYEDKPAFVAMVTPDLVAKGYNAGEIVKQVARVAGGSGGVKAHLAQAGGKDKDRVDEALCLVKKLI
ncbi:MAG: alanine--tRNA ligase [Dehalococcoidales bacterium]|nr:alanine--tRNA ligase [Dehalococcoidales bacterium]